jgi:superfamily II DNA or RNA helicase
MQSDIIDNLNIKFVDEIKKKLKVGKVAKFAVGWFFLNGLKEIKNELDELEKIYILAGSKTNKETAEVMLLSKKYERAVEYEINFKRNIPPASLQKILADEYQFLLDRISKIDPSKENVDFILWFLKKLKEKKIEIRVYPKETLHAKLYLIEYKDKNHGLGVGFVGSSNLSMSGFNLNTELNVAVYGDENFKKLEKWFDRLWDESKNANFTPLAEKAIEKSWILNKNEVTPFRVYLRILHEIFNYSDFSDIEKIDYGEVKLYDYQLDAVRDAYKRLNRHGGVFLADVPGLGKTYMGAALLAHLQEDGMKSLIICPPKLKLQWEEVLSEFGIFTAKVISSGKLDEVFQNEKLLKREVVLIDEAHHFRNPQTNRYKDMELICEGKKVILVGATPQNLSVWDLYHQIKLFTKSEVNHKFRIYPVILKEYFKAVEERRANIDDIINEIVIRRTRSDIKEHYTQKPDFPVRIGPKRIDYSIDKVYPGGIYNRLNQLIDKLNFARYDLGSYIKEEKFTPEERQRIKQAGKNLRKIMRMILFRRLESSIAALKDSAFWMLNTHNAFLKALNEGKVLAGEAADDVVDQLKSGVDVEDLEIPQETYDISFFNSPLLKEKIEKDKNIFEEIYNLVAYLDPTKDDKLNQLIFYLKNEVKGKKTIIFTEFSSTAKYLGENLKKYFDKVEFVTQDTGNVMTKAKRFSPKSNNFKCSKDEEIDILVSTEILSEGLNLQDGKVIFNYDLHWNPVRIIQRIGRIDRIGSSNDEIWVYNFFPQKEAEKEIGIEKKVTQRIEEIIKNYGADEKTITENEQTIRKKLFQIYTEDEKILQEEEKSSSKSTYFRHQWLKLKKDFSEEYKKALELPEMTICGLEHEKKGVVVFLRCDDYFKIYLSSYSGEIIEKDDWQILKYLETSKDKKSKDIHPNHLKVLEKVRQKFEEEINKREYHRSTYQEKIKEQIIKRLERIKHGQSKVFKTEVDEVSYKLRKAKLDIKAKTKLRSLRSQYALLPKEFLEKVKEVVENLKEEEKKPSVKKFAQIVISESLV